MSLVSVRDYIQNTLNLDLESKNTVTKVKMNLDDISIPDMIHLHKKTRDILFTHLLKITLALSKLQILKGKIENQMRQEKVENKAHQTHIKKLQIELLATGGQSDKGDGCIQRLLDEKGKEIQLLKNKILIPTTQLIQGPELADIEKEKENLNNQLTDCQANLLKFADKENQWQKDTALVVESEKSMKEKLE